MVYFKSCAVFSKSVSSYLNGSNTYTYIFYYHAMVCTSSTQFDIFSIFMYLGSDGNNNVRNNFKFFRKYYSAVILKQDYKKIYKVIKDSLEKVSIHTVFPFFDKFPSH